MTRSFLSVIAVIATIFVLAADTDATLRHTAPATFDASGFSANCGCF